jgi:hypothetical protein
LCLIRGHDIKIHDGSKEKERSKKSRKERRSFSETSGG